MHEWLLAEGIIEEAKKRGWRKVKIKLGKLQGIDREILEDAIKRISATEGVDLEYTIEEVDPVLKCKVCGYTWRPSVDGSKLEEIHFLPEAIFCFESCPKCSSRDFEILQGRGVEVEPEEDAHSEESK